MSAERIPGKGLSYHFATTSFFPYKIGAKTFEWQTESGALAVGQLTLGTFYARVDGVLLEKKFRTRHAAMKAAIKHRLDAVLKAHKKR